MITAWIGLIGTALGATIVGVVGIITARINAQRQQQTRFNELRVEAYTDLLKVAAQIKTKWLYGDLEVGAPDEVALSERFQTAYARCLLLASGDVRAHLANFLTVVQDLAAGTSADPEGYRSMQERFNAVQQGLCEAAQAEWGEGKRARVPRRSHLVGQ